jgi:hypothetical protein
MKLKLITLIAGLTAGVLSVYWLNESMLVDACLDMGGAINKENGACLSGETYEEYYMVVAWPMIAVYLFVGLLIAVLTTFLCRKLLNSIYGCHAKT